MLIDDGSTDSSASILQRYAQVDKRVKILSRPNSGVSLSRNHGLSMSLGKYISFVDADDVVDPNYLEVMYALIKQTQSQIVACQYTRDITRLGLRNDSYITLDSVGYLSEVLYQRLSDNSVWGKLYHRDVWHNIMFEPINYEDLEVYPRVCLNATSITFTSSRLYYYRENQASFTNNLTSRRFDVIEALRLIEQRLSDHTRYHQLSPAIRSRKLSASFNVFLISNGNEQYADINTKAWKNIRALRRECLTDRLVRPKLKAGIICSFMGKSFLIRLNKILKLSS